MTEKSRTHFVDICKVWPSCLQKMFYGIYGHPTIPLSKLEAFTREASEKGKRSYCDQRSVLGIAYWAAKDSPTFCFGEEFSRALINARGEWLHKDIAKEDAFVAQILFPQSLGFKIKSGEPCSAVFVFVHEQSETEKGMQFDFLAKGTRQSFASKFTEDGRIDWNDAPMEWYSTELVEFICRCIAYIRSADPDLRHLRPEIPKHASERKLKAFKAENPNLFPVTWVSWDWKRPRVYGVDETSVTGHFRWQPCGKRDPDTGIMTQTKLIWIDEHIRHFADKGESVSKYFPNLYDYRGLPKTDAVHIPSDGGMQ